MKDARPLPEARGLVPHRGPARFLLRVMEAAGDAIVGEGRIPEDSPYVRGGRFPTYVALDLAAQSAAALEVLEGPAAGDAGGPAGFIVRVRSLVQHREQLTAGTRLTVRARRTGRAAGLRIYRATIEAGGRPVLDCEFSTFVERG